MSFFSFKTKNNIIINAQAIKNLDYHAVVHEFSNSIIEMWIDDYDLRISLPFLKKLTVKNSREVDISTCLKIKEIDCSNLDLLDVGPLRPLVKGQVEMLRFEGQITLFNNLQINRLVNHK
jgi:hypothetical protein